MGNPRTQKQALGTIVFLLSISVILLAMVLLPRRSPMRLVLIVAGLVAGCGGAIVSSRPGR